METEGTITQIGQQHIEAHSMTTIQVTKKAKGMSHRPPPDTKTLTTTLRTTNKPMLIKTRRMIKDQPTLTRLMLIRILCCLLLKIP